MLKIEQNWGKIANYSPQCSTKICTTAHHQKRRANRYCSACGHHLQTLNHYLFPIQNVLFLSLSGELFFSPNHGYYIFDLGPDFGSIGEDLLESFGCPQKFPQKGSRRINQTPNFLPSSSVARGGSSPPPHWLVKYAKSHHFGGFEADFL